MMGSRYAAEERAEASGGDHIGEPEVSIGEPEALIVRVHVWKFETFAWVGKRLQEREFKGLEAR